jgi:hypothetical protein
MSEQHSHKGSSNSTKVLEPPPAMLSGTYAPVSKENCQTKSTEICYWIQHEIFSTSLLAERMLRMNEHWSDLVLTKQIDSA